MGISTSEKEVDDYREQAAYRTNRLFPFLVFPYRQDLIVTAIRNTRPSGARKKKCLSLQFPSFSDDNAIVKLQNLLALENCKCYFDYRIPDPEVQGISYEIPFQCYTRTSCIFFGIEKAQWIVCTHARY
jgi:hypothetical protein